MDRSSLIAKIQSISQGLDTVLTTDLSFYDKVLLKYKCQLFENFKKALVKDQTETEFKADLAQMLEEN